MNLKEQMEIMKVIKEKKSTFLNNITSLESGKQFDLVIGDKRRRQWTNT
jgi:hypothetical protein